MIISQYRSDYILLQSRLCLLTALIEYLNVLLEYLNHLQTRWQGTANIWEGLGPVRHAFWLHHCLKLLYLVFHMFYIAILVSDYCYFMLVHSL